MKLTQSILKENLHYDPSTGVFSWINTKRGRRPGVCGANSNGYLVICINYEYHRAHRLAWLYVHGYMPDMIDHINRDKADNRIANLRVTTNFLNQLNQNQIGRKSQSGHIGVHWDKRRRYWRAYIRCCKKFVEIGRYKTKEDAIEARRAYFDANYPGILIETAQVALL